MSPNGPHPAIKSGGCARRGLGGTRADSQEKFSELIIADGQAASRKVTRGVAPSSFWCRASHRDPVSLVKIHVRQPELSREEFQRRLLDEHAPLVLAQAATSEFVRRYAQLHTIGTTQEDPEAERMDAVSILAFASMNDVRDYLVSPEHEAVAASKTRLCATARNGGRR